MTDAQNDEHVVSEVRLALTDAAAQLAASGAGDEALAIFLAPRKVLFFTKNAVMLPAGRVWRLGVFLLGRDATLYATGALTRALSQGRSNHQSLSADRRREYRAAALRSSFAVGETVNFDAHPITLEPKALRSSPGPLFISDGRAWVCWSTVGATASASASAAPADFDKYLADRVGLLLHPPEGS